ncbi:MAG: hypothetical protein WCY12_01645, partial [Candidatus Omnitrophota bacterium]
MKIRFVLLGLLVLICFFGFMLQDASCADTVAPVLVKFEYEAFAARYGYLKVYWKTDEPVQYITYGTSYVASWSSDFIIEPENGYTYLSMPYNSVSQWHMEFRDKAGNVTVTPTFSFSNYVFLRGNININDGAILTNSRQVTLNIWGFDPEYAITEMSFSNDNKNWSKWEKYQETKKWKLSAEEGSKAVYMRLKNSAGFFMNIPVCDGIYYTSKPAPAGISRVDIKGRQLLVQKALADGRKTGFLPYKIKGVELSGFFTGDNSFSQEIALMKAMGVNTVVITPSSSQNYTLENIKTVLDEFYKNEIRVIISVDYAVGSSYNLDFTRLDWIIANFRTHPVILAWMCGYYYYDSVGQIIERVKQDDPYHPLFAREDGNKTFFIIPA